MKKNTVLKVMGAILVIGMAIGFGGYLGNMRTTTVSEAVPYHDNCDSYGVGWYEETRNGFGIVVESGFRFEEGKSI